MPTSPVLIPISKNGKIVIPKKIRQALKWNEGKELTLIQVRQGILIKSTARIRAEAIIRQSAENVCRNTQNVAPEEAREHWRNATEVIRKSLRKAQKSKRNTK